MLKPDVCGMTVGERSGGVGVEWKRVDDGVRERLAETTSGDWVGDGGETSMRVWRGSRSGEPLRIAGDAMGWRGGTCRASAEEARVASSDAASGRWVPASSARVASRRADLRRLAERWNRRVDEPGDGGVRGFELRLVGGGS